MEEQIKREKVDSKGWKVQTRKLEANILNLGSQPSYKKGNKKLLDEKDKLIESLQKKLEGQVIDHPHTEEIMYFQTKNRDLKKEVMELNAKLLQVTKVKEDLAKEKDEFVNKRVVEVPSSTSHLVDTTELTRSLAQVSLKEKEISQLLQEKNQLQKSNQEKQDRINRLKDRLLGKEVLNSAQHSLSDLISIEVNKFWSELKRMEAKKACIYSALEKHKLATKQLVRLHKEPVEKALSVINFLKFSSDEALQAFKVTDRYQTIMLVKRVIDKDELIRKVHNRTEALQKEIKEIYAIFKPLIEKGLPHFWDTENRLLKKE